MAATHLAVRPVRRAQVLAPRCTVQVLQELRAAAFLRLVRVAQHLLVIMGLPAWLVAPIPRRTQGLTVLVQVMAPRVAVAAQQTAALAQQTSVAPETLFYSTLRQVSCSCFLVSPRASTQAPQSGVSVSAVAVEQPAIQVVAAGHPARAVGVVAAAVVAPCSQKPSQAPAPSRPKAETAAMAPMPQVAQQSTTATAVVVAVVVAAVAS